MRKGIVLPEINYGDGDNFAFPPLANRLTKYNQDTTYTPWGAGKVFPFHGFVDDWRIESIWRDSYMMLSKFVNCVSPCAIAPDYTVEHDYPLALAFHQVWRSRVVAKAWQDAGVYVIPALQWSRPALNNILFQGLDRCEVVAVRSPTKGFERPWCEAAKQFLSIASPKLVLHFGTSRGINVWGDKGKQMNLNTYKAVCNG